MLFYVDTLEHLRRGGRIGAASALLGSALAIKPLLVVAAAGTSSRSRRSARRRGRWPGMEELAVRAIDAAGADGVDIAVHHLDSLDRADAARGAAAHRAAGRRRGRRCSSSVPWSARTWGPAPSPSPCRPAPAGPADADVRVRRPCPSWGWLVVAVAGRLPRRRASARRRSSRGCRQGDLTPGVGQPGRHQRRPAARAAVGRRRRGARRPQGTRARRSSRSCLGRPAAYAVGLACVLGHVRSPFLAAAAARGSPPRSGRSWRSFPVVRAGAGGAVRADRVAHPLGRRGVAVGGGGAGRCGRLFGPLPEPVLLGRLWGLAVALLIIARHQPNIRLWLRQRSR